MDRLPPSVTVTDLTELPLRVAARVVGLKVDDTRLALARRLDALGFVPGEPVQVSVRGPFGGDPLLVDVGSTRFALRRAEAACVQVRVDDLPADPAVR